MQEAVLQEIELSLRHKFPPLLYFWHSNQSGLLWFRTCSCLCHRFYLSLNHRLLYDTEPERRLSYSATQNSWSHKLSCLRSGQEEYKENNCHYRPPLSAHFSNIEYTFIISLSSSTRTLDLRSVVRFILYVWWFVGFTCYQLLSGCRIMFLVHAANKPRISEHYWVM